MKASSDEPNNNLKAIDATVGSLVWVRRRNGSWWPGRIMGLDEISESSLVSPKSGTPVKLLGREDASVDWYNLEKSKRVKAFRCGEYDECIEKARTAAANGNKKAVKYARREDAILHALEIENALLGKDHLDLFSRTNNLSDENGSSAKDSASMPRSGKESKDMTAEKSDSDGSDSDSDPSSDPGSGSDSDSDSDSAPELSQSGISFEEPNHAGVPKAQPVQAKRRKTPNDSEDDGTEGTKRMKGLEDLGIGVGDSNCVNCVSNAALANGSKVSNSPMKRKLSQSANVHEFLKRKNRRRPLTKVLESTAMVAVPVICNRLPSSCRSPLQVLSDSKISGVDSNDSRKSLCVVINNYSDSTGLLCENDASLNPSEHACDASPTDSKVKKENDTSGALGLVENDSIDKLFDVPFVGDEKQATDFSPMLVMSSSLRHQGIGSRRQFSQGSQAEALPLKNEGLDESASTSSAANHVNNISQTLQKDTSKWQLKGKRNSRHLNKNRKQCPRNYVDMDDEPNAYLAGEGQMDGFLQGSSRPFTEDQVDGIQDWRRPVFHKEPHMVEPLGSSLPPQKSLPYRRSRFILNSKYQTADFPGRSFRPASRLCEVKLEVKANYRPQHVPLVSLMSKLNGKAIVGHPLTIEHLNDGYWDDIISSSGCDATHVTVLESAEWKNAVCHSEARRVCTKDITLQPQFSPGKSLKMKKSGLLSKKIRKLSSLTGNKGEDRKAVVEKLKGPVIACIPLRLVFSRLKEGVNGSAQQSQQHALTSGNS